MPEMKNSFLKIKSVFTDTKLGKVSLELNTSRDKVLAISPQGIQSSTRVDAVQESQDQWISACRDADEDKFSKLVGKLSEV